MGKAHTPRDFNRIAEVAPATAGERPAGFNLVQAFLEQFGYLQPGEYTSGQLDSATSAALAGYQEFNLLPVTGQFDHAVRNAMTKPRCGMPDLSRGMPDRLGRADFRTVCRWDKAELTYVLDTGTADVVGQTEWTAVRAAFATWQALGVLTFREVSLGQDPDIVWDWRPADDPDYNMVGTVLAHADYPPGCPFISASLPKPVHFDDSENAWAVGAVVGSFDIETVALHELGHIVGLDHSMVAGAVMLPTVAPNFTLRTLSQDDIDGFKALYAKVPDCRGKFPAAAAAVIRAARLRPEFTGGGFLGRVTKQDPPAGTIVDPGTIVTLTITGIPK